MKQYFVSLSAVSQSPGLRLLVILFLIFQTFQPASAQWSSDPSVNTRVNGGTSARGFEKQVVRSENGFFVSWSDYRKGGEHPELYMQYLNARGERQWANNGKAICPNSGGQSSALMTPDGSGGVIVAWIDYRPGLNPADPWATDIYAQRINARGELLWNEKGVPVCTFPWGQYVSDIISDQQSGAYIIWTDNRYGITQTYLQHIDENGQTQWEQDGKAVCPGYGDYWSRGLLTENGNLIVVWSDDRYGSSMFAQMLNQMGDRLWQAEGILVGDALKAQYYPAIVTDGLGGAFITWLDTRDAASTSLYGQKIDADGEIKWPIGGKHIASPVNSQRVPLMVSDGNGGFIVTWDDRGLDDQVNDVYAQRIDADGNKKWGDKGVAVSTPGNRQYWPSVVSDKKGGAIIAWQDRVVTDFDNSRVIAQHLDSTGKKLWEESGVIVTDAEGQKFYPAMADNGQGGAVVVWSDERLFVEGRAGVYVQNISPTGALGCQVMKIDEQPLKKQTVYKDSLPATLEVIATGDDLRYQWFFNSVAGYSGATMFSEPGDDSKITPPTNSPGTRYYFCRVMNRCDTLYSNLAEVVVLENITGSNPEFNIVLDIRVMPNPTSSEWIFEVISPDANRFELRIIEMTTGRTVFYQQGVPGQTFNAGSHFAPGVYLVEVQQSGQKFVKRVLKL